MRTVTAHTPLWMKECVARLAAGATLTLLLAGCSVVLSRPPAPEAGSTREEVRLRRDLCSLSGCPVTVDVGSRRFQVKSHHQQSTLDEAIRHRKQSLAGRALTAIGDDIVRDLGGTTTRTLVVTSTHAVAGPSLPLLLDCDAVWIGEEHQEEVPEEERLDNSPPGQQRVSRVEVASGLACRASAPGDTAPMRWHIRRGIVPAQDSLALVLHALSRGDSLSPSAAASATLERVLPDAAADTIARYAVRHGSSGEVQILRADGTLVGTLFPASRVVDIGGAADPEEAVLLRLLIALLLASSAVL
jgi:hypothetical protein